MAPVGRPQLDGLMIKMDADLMNAVSGVLITTFDIMTSLDFGVFSSSSHHFFSDLLFG